MDGSFKAKVADFGLSSKRSSSGLIGTPYWMAPELLIGRAPSVHSDVYAFGVLLFEIFTRHEPYEGEDPASVLLAVADRSLAKPKRPVIPPEVPLLFADIMNACWAPDPAARPTFQAIADQLRSIDSTAVAMTLLAQAEDRYKTQKLVTQVFPPKVASALKEGRAVEPEEYDCVTIFFSDIVGFTEISKSLEPRLVMDMLDRLYEKFDALVAHYELFKVETIGDTYMVVGNLPDPQADHTARVAHFAIDAVAAADTVEINVEDPSLGNIEIRVGFHAGPCVASVVGRINPRYCLFGCVAYSSLPLFLSVSPSLCCLLIGVALSPPLFVCSDTVNTASRMESNSEPGCVHLSHAACGLLQAQAPYMRVASRGRVSIKGKGEMETFWLLPPDMEGGYPELAPTGRHSQASAYNTERTWSFSLPPKSPPFTPHSGGPRAPSSSSESLVMPSLDVGGGVGSGSGNKAPPLPILSLSPPRSSPVAVFEAAGGRHASITSVDSGIRGHRSSISSSTEHDGKRGSVSTLGLDMSSSAPSNFSSLPTSTSPLAGSPPATAPPVHMAEGLQLDDPAEKEETAPK